MNNGKPRSGEALSLEQLRAWLAYNPETGEFLWLPRKCRRHTGRAGYLRKDGNWQIKINDRTYLAHRLAWFWMTGSWPVEEIDHVNLSSSDNRWENLREATRAQNSANRRVSAANRSGYKGVGWHKPSRKWFARIKVNKKAIFLGHFDTVEDARVAYAEASLRHHGEFGRIS